MIAIGLLFLRMLCDCFKPQQRLEAEILVLRHQLNVLQRHTPRRRLQLRWADRALFIWLYRRYPRVLDAVTIVRPETVVRWHRKGFAAYWRWKSRSPGGRLRIAQEVLLGDRAARLGGQVAASLRYFGPTPSACPIPLSKELFRCDSAVSDGEHISVVSNCAINFSLKHGNS